ncbi:hypothetical protein ACFSKS_17880 [Pseudocitrobacter faecalis]
MSRFFYDDRKQLVNDAIEGLVLSAPHGNLMRLDIDPAIRIVARSDWDKSRVAVISGGVPGMSPPMQGSLEKAC